MGEHMWISKRYRIVASAGACLGILLSSGGGPRFAAQDSGMHLRVNVNLVQLNVAVTDSKGNYITGLRPEDFAITEDKISQRLATFEEGDFNVRTLGHGCPARRRQGCRQFPRQRTTASDHQLFGCKDFAAGGRQHLHPVRYQQLHVPRLRLRAGCHLRLRALHG